MAQWTTPDYLDERGGVALISGVPGVILGPFLMPHYETRSFTVYNANSAVTLSGVEVQINPDPSASMPGLSPTTLPVPNPSLWHVYNATALANIGPGTAKSFTATDVAYRWWRLVGTNSGSQSVTVSGWVIAVTR